MMNTASIRRCVSFRKRLSAACALSSAVLLVGLISASGSRADDSSLPANLALRQAREFLAGAQPEKALSLFTDLIEREEHLVASLIGAGRACGHLERPDEALAYYLRAIGEPTADLGARRVAMFGAARMYLWLERYTESASLYSALLNMDLDAEDLELAATGLTRSVSLGGSPMRAYSEITGSVSLEPMVRFEKARAAWWAQWPDRAREMISDAVELPSGSRQAREAAVMTREIEYELGDQIAQEYQVSHDSDDLTVHKTAFHAGLNIHGPTSSAVVVLLTRLSQGKAEYTYRSVQARFASRMGDHLWVSGQGGPAWHDSWRHGLWSLAVIHRPDDHLGASFRIYHDLVDSFEALSNRLTLTEASMRLDSGSLNGLWFAATMFGQRISDGNRRVGSSMELSRQIHSEIGLLGHLRGRYFRATDSTLTGYFNPRSFGEGKFLLELKRRINPEWRVSTILGTGIQEVYPGDRSMTSYAQFYLQGHLTRTLLATLELGYFNSALSSSSGYRNYLGGMSISSTW